MTTISLPTYVVRVNGSVDRDATVSKFESDLDSFIAERETEQGVIAEAVNAVFDQYRGARCNMPFLTSTALNRLNAGPSNHKALTERVQEYVRSNAGTRESGALFSIAKGAGGGVGRWVDLPEAKASDKK